jgi:hypothetical protein
VLPKQPGIEQCGNYIVEGVGAGDYAKSSRGENNGKENSCNSSESKTGQSENFRFCKLSVEKYKMMMKTEKDGRYNHGYDHGFKFVYAENRFKKNKRKTYENQPENQLFVNSRPDAGQKVHRDVMTTVVILRSHTVGGNICRPVKDKRKNNKGYRQNKTFYGHHQKIARPDFPALS